MRIELTLTDEEGKTYHGSAELSRTNVFTRRVISKAAPPSSKSLPSHILELRNQGFFHEPRTGNEVHERLQKTYHCDLDRVLMALLRLVRRRELRESAKSIAGRSQVAYVW